jgi:16S rRNA (cytosine967-C5)-methyltransferase
VSAFEPRQKQTVRQMAADILVKVETRKAYADALLDDKLNSAVHDNRDRALLTEIIYGTLRWRGRLDAYLKPWIRRPLKDTDPFVRNLLRLTLYQLILLDRVPDYAAVNEAVELAKAHAGGSTAGFVNGVLRNVLRTKREPAQPAPDDGSVAEMAESWSHPMWLVQYWRDYFGNKDLQPLLQTNNEEAPLVLRTNSISRTRSTLLDLFRNNAIKACASPWSPVGIAIQSRVVVDQLPGYNEGLFQVQGDASQLVTYLLDPQPGERILDACAGPGGKATHIAEAIKDQGSVIAIDISSRGIQRVEQNARRLGLSSIQAFKADASRPLAAPLSEPYDRVLVDAPCSGFGTLRSHPEIKWNRKAADIKRLAYLQKTILARAASLVKTGGVIVYSTCTLTREENENVVEDFLANHEEFVLADPGAYLPDQARSMARGCYFLALPHRHNTDGFFAARMRRVK